MLIQMSKSSNIGVQGNIQKQKVEIIIHGELTILDIFSDDPLPYYSN